MNYSDDFKNILVPDIYKEAFITKWMNVEEFITHIKKYQQYFIKYCECIIDRNGDIRLAIPSHEQALIEFLLEKGICKTREEISEKIPLDCSPSDFIADKYSVEIVWYSRIVVPHAENENQLRTVKRLNDVGILDTGTIIPNREYSNYLYRKEMGIY